MYYEYIQFIKDLERRNRCVSDKRNSCPDAGFIYYPEEIKKDVVERKLNWLQRQIKRMFNHHNDMSD